MNELFPESAARGVSLSFTKTRDKICANGELEIGFFS